MNPEDEDYRSTFKDDEEDGENAILGWLKAVALGIRDTASDMLDEGRRGAQEAYDEGWDRYDDKTKRRRTRDR